MSQRWTGKRDIRFLLGFAAIVVVVAAGFSYLADPDPDGLDAMTQQGCVVTEDEQLVGNCIAQNAKDHPLSSSPLADYAVGGDDRLTGLAGVAGAAAAVLVAGGLFWLLRRPSGSRED